MKKVLVLLVLVLFFPVSFVKAETLDEYIAKAEAALKAQKEANEKKKVSEEEKAKAQEEKVVVEADIKKTEAEIENLIKEMDALEEKIDKKDKEIKSIMKFVQVSNGEANYMEYIFGATSFTDFIYRISVAEQLSDYNDKLIKEYNNTITELNAKKDELKTKEDELSKKKTELSELIQKLADEIDDLTDSAQSSEEEYKNFMNYVNQLKDKGCRGNEDMAACRARQDVPKASVGSVTGGGNANGFFIPLTNGRVTQDYKGPYVHNAIDVSNYEGAPVYAITSGVVRVVSSGCGERVVYIVHNVGGRMYTTVYYHLKSVTVSVGQSVSYTTQIGTQGGNPAHGATCGCTGSHVDFKLFTGEYPYDFQSLTGNGASHNINPRIWLTQLPSPYVYFNSR